MPRRYSQTTSLRLTEHTIGRLRSLTNHLNLANDEHRRWPDLGRSLLEQALTAAEKQAGRGGA